MYPREDPNNETFKCQYHKAKQDQTLQDPHFHIPFEYERKLIYNNICEVIGNTPLVKLNKIPQSFGVKCEILAKCEFLNPGGSLKDRIGYRMIQEAERSKRIKVGDTLIEATSGNTGIGLALASAVFGYNIWITLPEKMSTEKTDVLSVLGANIVRTPTEAAFDDDNSHISKAIKLNKTLPNSHILDQYINPGNTLAHYDGTGSEIIHQTQGKLDYIFVGTGTGGTISGIARKLKEQIPNCKVIGVDPHGSILAQPQSMNTKNEPYLMEGIGYDFVPRVIDRTVVDDWIKVDDNDALPMTRRIIREEGMFCGGSSGAILTAAINYAKEKTLNENHRIVVIFGDNIRNYITKLVSKEYMVDKGFMKPLELVNEEHKLKGRSLSDLKLSSVPIFDKTATLKQVIEYFDQNEHIDGVPILNNGKITHVVFQQKLMELIVRKEITLQDTVQKVWTLDYSLNTWENLDCASLEALLVRRPCVFIEKINEGKQEVYIAKHKDLLQLLKQMF